MKIEKLNEENMKLWETFIDNEKNSRFQHLLKFKKVIEKTYKNCKGEYYFSKNNGKIKAIFPFVSVKSKLLGDRMISLPFLDNGGFLGEYGKKGIKELFKNLENIEIRLNSSMKNFSKDKKILNSLGLRADTSRQQFIVKLTSEKDLWKRFHKHTRNDIRKAEKSGLKLKSVVLDEELKKFYKLYFENMKFFGTPQHSYKFFKNLFEIMKENVVGFNCYYKDSLAGSIIMFYEKKYGYISFNVSNPKYREYRPNDILYWEMIKLAIKKGIKYIDLGQIEKDSLDSRAIGLYKFKRKWMGDPHDRVYFSFEKKEKGKKNRLKKFRKIWKKVPSSILKKVGPKIAAQLAI